MEQNYNIDYFLKKFDAIPEDKWIIAYLQDPIDQDKHCALGHCGVRNNYNITTEESIALMKIFNKNHKRLKRNISKGNFSNVYLVNDGDHYYDYIYGETPKERVINFLEECKAYNLDIDNPIIENKVEEFHSEAVILTANI